MTAEMKWKAKSNGKRLFLSSHLCFHVQVVHFSHFPPSRALHCQSNFLLYAWEIIRTLSLQTSMFNVHNIATVTITVRLH